MIENPLPAAGSSHERRPSMKSRSLPRLCALATAFAVAVLLVVIFLDGPPPRNYLEDSQHIIMSADHDGDRHVSEKELIKGLFHDEKSLHEAEVEHVERVRAAFPNHDADGNGKLNDVELSRLLMQVEGGVHPDNVEL